MSAEASSSGAQTLRPKQVLYCEVCTLPPEYCEFGSHLTKCKAWLQEAHPNLYDQFYSDDALAQKASALSLDQQQKIEQDAAKKEAKAEARADAEAKKRQTARITIKRIARNKNKYVTAVHGLEQFSIDLKKAAKQFAQKFATGASVTKNAQGLDEVVVQGDVSEEIQELLEEQVGVLKGIDADKIVLVEEKAKKKGGAASTAAGGED